MLLIYRLAAIELLPLLVSEIAWLGFPIVKTLVYCLTFFFFFFLSDAHPVLPVLQLPAACHAQCGAGAEAARLFPSWHWAPLRPHPAHSPSSSLPVVSIATTDFLPRPSPPAPPCALYSPLCYVWEKGAREGEEACMHVWYRFSSEGRAAEGLCLRSVPPAVSEPQTRWPANWSALCAVPVGLPDNSQWTQCPLSVCVITELLPPSAGR